MTHHNKNFVRIQDLLAPVEPYMIKGAGRLGYSERGAYNVVRLPANILEKYPCLCTRQANGFSFEVAFFSNWDKFIEFAQNMKAINAPVSLVLSISTGSKKTDDN